MLFAAPPTSTYDEALALFLKAEQMQPDFYKTNKLFLAKTYLRLNRSDEVSIMQLKQLREFVVVSSSYYLFIFYRKGEKVARCYFGDAVKDTR